MKMEYTLADAIQEARDKAMQKRNEYVRELEAENAKLRAIIEDLSCCESYDHSRWHFKDCGYCSSCEAKSALGETE